MSLLLKGGISKLSELEIDADKDWQGWGISNIKEVAAGMAIGHILQHNGVKLVKLLPGTANYVLTSEGPGKLVTWAPGGTYYERYFPVSIESAHAEGVVTPIAILKSAPIAISLNYPGAAKQPSIGSSKSVGVVTPVTGRQLRALQFPGSQYPYGLAWQSPSLFVVDQVSPTSQIYEINPYDGSVVRQFAAPGTSYQYNRGLTHDGTDLWITGYDSGLSPAYRVYRISDIDGTVLQNWGAPNGAPANGLAWDGTYIWVVQSTSPYQLHQCNPADGSIVASITPPYATSEYRGITWDGAYLWGVSPKGERQYYAYRVCQINSVNGNLAKEFITPMYGINTNWIQPWGLTWDGEYLWLGGYGNVEKGIWQICANPVRFDYAGCEVVDDESYVNPSGSFTVRRYFTNKSGGSITVNEVGIYALMRELAIARDLVSPGVAVLNNETLKVEYTFQITV
jgi:hypothetical protein